MSNSNRPNFVIFYTDNQGYGDLSCMARRSNLKDQFPEVTAELREVAAGWRADLEKQWQEKWEPSNNTRTAHHSR